MIAVLLATQVSLTPGALVDQATKLYGFGAIGTSPDQETAIPVSAANQGDEVAIRARNAWRVVRDANVPAVFRPEVAPYAELFDEERFPLLRDGKPIVPAGRLGFVNAADLNREGGVRVKVDRLAELLDARALRIPALYGRRTVLVRIDPNRMPDPVDLIAAVTGGVPNADRTAIDVEPKGYRKLAVATLSAEARRTEFDADPIPPGDRRAYWEQRSLRLALGAAAFYEADDESLRLLGRASGRSLVISATRLNGQGTELANGLMEIYSRNGVKPPFNPGKLVIPGVPQIKVSGSSGQGQLALPPDASGTVRFL